MSHRWLALLALVLAVLLASCGQTTPTQEPILIRVSGSSTMRHLVADLGEGYSLLSPEVSLEVVGIDTGYGLEAVADGRADIAMASWLPGDLASGLQATPIARDAVAVVVHTDNELSALGMVELQALYSGARERWGLPVGHRSETSVQPVSREEGSGTRAAFEQIVMGDLRVTLQAVVSHSSDAVVEYVAEHPEAIGYVSLGSLTPGVKVLTLEGVEPTASNAALGSYPLTRELWLVYPERPGEAVQAFVHYVLSPAGQEKVGRTFGRLK